MSVLAQRVGLHQSQRALQRSVVRSRRRVGGQQPLQRAQILLAAPLALVERPVVVAVLQKVAAIERDGGAQRGDVSGGGGQVLVEAEQVDGGGGVGAEGDGIAAKLKQRGV